MATLQDMLEGEQRQLDEGPALRTGALDVYSRGGGLRQADVQGLINYFKANREAGMTMQELQQAAQERELTRQAELARRAALGDQRAAAEMVAAKTREEQRPVPGTPFNLKQLLGVTSGLKGLPEEAASSLLSRLIPGLPAGRSKSERLEEELKLRARIARPEKVEAEERGQRNREETFFFQNMGRFINKKTGQKATELTAVPSYEEVKRDFTPLTTQQSTNVDALKGLDNQIQEYSDIMEELNFPQPGVGVWAKGIGLKGSRLFGGEQAARLDAVRAEITQLARAFGGDSRVSQEEMKLLRDAVLSDFESGPSAKAIIGVLKRFRTTRAQSLGIPGLMTPTKVGKELTVEKANEFKAKAKGDRKLAEKMAREEGYAF